MSEAEMRDERGTKHPDPDTQEQAHDATVADLESDTAAVSGEQDDVDELDEADGSGSDDTEDEPVARGCWACQAELKHQYYEVDAHAICAGCAARVKNPESQGTSFGRFIRAITYGCGAGVVGASLYYGILALTGYEVGLVAIAVGFMVGYAVKEGSYGRGGWRYQLIAMAITYVAIVMTYVPMIVEGFEQDMAREAASTDAGVVVEPATAGAFHWALAIVIALFAPFVFGLENIMGTIILLIGLYEAWKINHRPKVQIEGPFALGAGSPALPEATASAG